MNISLSKLVDSITVLNKIKSQNPNFKVSYWIMRNIKILSSSFDFFISSREEIYNKYCYKEKSKEYPQGSYFSVNQDGSIKFNLKQDADIDQFNNDMKELLEMECDNIEPYLLSIEDINNMSNIQLEGNDIFTIDYLLEQ